MTKNEAIANAVRGSIETGICGFVREFNGDFYVSADRKGMEGSKWHGTAKNGKYSTAKSIRARVARKERESIMRDCGLVKVRGAVSGKIYWE